MSAQTGIQVRSKRATAATFDANIKQAFSLVTQNTSDLEKLLKSTMVVVTTDVVTEYRGRFDGRRPSPASGSLNAFSITAQVGRDIRSVIYIQDTAALALVPSVEALNHELRNIERRQADIAARRAPTGDDAVPFERTKADLVRMRPRWGRERPRDLAALDASIESQRRGAVAVLQAMRDELVRTKANSSLIRGVNTRIEAQGGRSDN